MASVMIENAIILAAGQGSRLLPITATRPKCLVQIGGQSLLDHQLQALAAAGVAKVTVVTGYRHDQVAQAVAGPQPLEVAVRFNPFWAVASSIASAWIARDLLRAPFCLLNGDTLFDPAIVATALEASPDAPGLLVEPVAGADYDDMLVRVADGAVLAVTKDLPESEATHRSLGLVVARSGFLDYAGALDTVIAERNGAGAYHHDIVDRMARTGRIAAIERSEGYWQEIDRPQDIARWRAEHEGGDGPT